MKPQTVSVFLDYKCNFSCGHCSVGSSPEAKFKMDDSYLDQVFEQVQSMPSVEVIVFTGGEVTLHWETLLEGIARAKELGYMTRIVTNSWWAHDIERARDGLEELLDAGLDEISTSYDDFHTDFTDPEPILNLIEAGMETDRLKNLSVATVIGHEDPEYDKARMEELLSERFDCPPEEFDDRLVLIEDKASPLGHGAQLDVSDLEPADTLLAGCKDVINTVSVHPDGSVKACCGHAQWYVPDLTLGSLDEETLPEIVDRSGQNLVYWLIHKLGPKQLLEELGVDNHHSGICHACHDLLGNHREEFLEYIREETDDVRTMLIQNGSFKTDAQAIVEKREEIMDALEDTDDVGPGALPKIVS
ncbi:radical SAM protein [Halorussus halobius]|uniref:radical SAM protein n=1 Tax=Halorussus halobius TaxID=1710537 RepID=UPI001091A28D|nr:radical SAM/SPASM domain-containing protein [Halorussus halobius]